MCELLSIFQFFFKLNFGQSKLSRDYLLFAGAVTLSDTDMDKLGAYTSFDHSKTEQRYVLYSPYSSAALLTFFHSPCLLFAVPWMVWRML